MKLDRGRPSRGAVVPMREFSGLVASLLTFGAYLTLALVGIRLASTHGGASPLWPAAGAALAALYAFGPRVLPALALAAFVANLATPRLLVTDLFITSASVVEAYVAWWLGRRMEERGLPHAVALPLGLTAGAVVGTAAAAVALVTTGALPTSDLSNMLVTWWVGDFVGGLLVAPALIACKPVLVAVEGRVDRLGRLALVAVATVALSVVTFHLPGWGAQLIFLPFVALLIGVSLAGAGGAHIAALAASASVVMIAARGIGPFTGETLNEALLLLQTYIAALAVTALALAAAPPLVLRRLPIVVLIAGWLFSSALFAALRSGEQSFDRVRFDRMIASTQADIERRLAVYRSALRGGAGYIAAVGDVTRAQWRQFADSLRLLEQYPGIRGIGVVRPVSATDFPSLERMFDSDGPEAAYVHDVSGVSPPLPRAEHFVITRVFPESTNLAALGLDLASEPHRAEGATASRDQGVAVRTARIVLVQDELKRAGFLLYLPVYDPAKPIATVDQRRAALRGWVYAPFVTEDLFVTATHDAQLDFWVYDAATTEPATLAATTRRDAPVPVFEGVTQVQFGGLPFTIGWARGPAFNVGQGASAAWAATFGAMLTLMIAGLVVTMQTLNERATAIAAERTVELSVSRERALEASRVKSQFLANMSHEIRTPLNGVIGMTEMLLLSEPLTPQQHDNLETVRTSAMNLLAIVNDILDLSRIEAGRLHLDVEPFSVEQVVRETVRAFAAAAERKGLVLSLGVEPGTRVARVGDALRVRQIVSNLVGNAIKFTERGRVDVFIATGAEGAIQVTVADTGIGISEDRLAAVFEPFTQADGTMTRRYGGTGLGLTICVDLARAMGGDVTAESTLGHGSRFVFTAPLPVTEAPMIVPSAPTTIPTATSSRALHVLVADDDPINTMVLELFLAKHGHRVTKAANGQEAVDAVLHGGIDLVFMDVQMPVLDGLDATRRIRAIEAARGGHVSVFGLSANAMRGDEDIAAAAGMDGYLTKPVELKRVLEVVAGVQAT